MQLNSQHYDILIRQHTSISFFVYLSLFVCNKGRTRSLWPSTFLQVTGTILFQLKRVVVAARRSTEQLREPIC